MIKRDTNKRSVPRAILNYILFLVKTFCLGSVSFGCLILLAAISIYSPEKALMMLLLLAIAYCYPRLIIFFWKRAQFLGPPTKGPERNLSLEPSWKR